MEDKVCVKWADRIKCEWLPKCQVRDLTLSRSRSNATNARNLSEVDKINLIYRRIRDGDTGSDNGTCRSLPFSNFHDFIALLQSNQKWVIHEKELQEEVKQKKRKNIKKCMKCNSNVT